MSPSLWETPLAFKQPCCAHMALPLQRCSAFMWSAAPKKQQAWMCLDFPTVTVGPHPAHNPGRLQAWAGSQPIRREEFHISTRIPRPRSIATTLMCVAKPRCQPPRNRRLLNLLQVSLTPAVEFHHLLQMKRFVAGEGWQVIKNV